MQIKLTIKEKEIMIDLPDEIYLDQLLQLDMNDIKSFENLDNVDYIVMGRLFLKFFKVLGVKRRFTMPEFLTLAKHPAFGPWLKGLLSDFQAGTT